jgi:hypothetical protein
MKRRVVSIDIMISWFWMRREGGGEKRTLFPDAVALNPGGSGIPVDFGFATGGLLRSITHCGGGGGGADIFAVLKSIYA